MSQKIALEANLAVLSYDSKVLSIVHQEITWIYVNTARIWVAKRENKWFQRDQFWKNEETLNCPPRIKTFILKTDLEVIANTLNPSFLEECTDHLSQLPTDIFMRLLGVIKTSLIKEYEERERSVKYFFFRDDSELQPITLHQDFAVLRLVSKYFLKLIPVRDCQQDKCSRKIPVMLDKTFCRNCQNKCLNCGNKISQDRHNAWYNCYWKYNKKMYVCTLCFFSKYVPVEHIASYISQNATSIEACWNYFFYEIDELMLENDTYVPIYSSLIQDEDRELHRAYYDLFDAYEYLHGVLFGIRDWTYPNGAKAGDLKKEFVQLKEEFFKKFSPKENLDYF